MWWAMGQPTRRRLQRDKIDLAFLRRGGRSPRCPTQGRGRWFELTANGRHGARVPGVLSEAQIGVDRAAVRRSAGPRGTHRRRGLGTSRGRDTGPPLAFWFRLSPPGCSPGRSGATAQNGRPPPPHQLRCYELVRRSVGLVGSPSSSMKPPLLVHANTDGNVLDTMKLRTCSARGEVGAMVPCQSALATRLRSAGWVGIFSGVARPWAIESHCDETDAK